MTDLHEAFGALVTTDPPTTVDPYAAITTGRQRRRTNRQRWAAGGLAAVLVLGAGALVGVPKFDHSAPLATSPATTAGAGHAWIGTDGTAKDGLDIRATSDAVASIDVPALLGLPAADSAASPLPSSGGSLRLAYMTRDGDSVEVLLAGPRGLPSGAFHSCPAIIGWVLTPSVWPPITQGSPRGESCGGRLAATSVIAAQVVERAVTEPGVNGGRVTVTISATGARKGALPPVTVAHAFALLDQLASRLVFRDDHRPTGAAPSVTYLGPVAKTQYLGLVSATLDPPTAAPRVTWQRAYDACRAYSGPACQLGANPTIVLADVSAPYPATILPNGTADPALKRRLTYVMTASGQCPAPAGPGPGRPRPSIDPNRVCTEVSLVDANTGDVVYAAEG